MTDVKNPADLIVVVPDGDMEATVRALFKRPLALGIRPISFDVKRHSQRDAGCRSGAHDFLRLWLRSFQYALVLFDHEGCGQEDKLPEIVEINVKNRLEANGWRGRCGVVVISPELESWVWSDSPEVDEVLGWSGRHPGLRDWIRLKTDYWQDATTKPERPKEAFESALRAANRPRSTALFESLAGKVSVERCTDPSFTKFKAFLRSWFPGE